MSEEHLGGCYTENPDLNTFMPDIWQWLIDRHQIKSVIDVGCGAGWNTVWFHDRGLYAVGVEGWPEAIARTRMPMQRMIVHDYTKGPLESSRRFDLCWSSEFVEHVEEQFVPNFMATFKCAKRVCMTYATPGQGGFHHCVIEDSRISARGLKSASRRAYKGDVITIETARGHKLSVTPNHPILTSGGWVLAKALQEGGDVISSECSDWMLRHDMGDDHYGPATAKEIFASLSEMVESRSTEMPSSPKDFHGDGADGEIQIVRTNRNLLREIHTTPRKPLGKSSFQGRDSGPIILIHQGAGPRLVSVAGGRMHSGDSFPHLPWRETREHDVCATRTRNFNAVAFHHLKKMTIADFEVGRNLLNQHPFGQKSSDFGRRNGLPACGLKTASYGDTDFQKLLSSRPEISSRSNANFVNRLPGLVSPDKIIKVHLSKFFGSVHNFSTKSGMYIAEGIVSHNCNEQPFEYWIECMKENGFTLDREATDYMRATDNGAAWGRRTLTLFENQGV